VASISASAVVVWAVRAECLPLLAMGTGWLRRCDALESLNTLVVTRTDAKDRRALTTAEITGIWR
jgi:hypothetical protein